MCQVPLPFPKGAGGLLNGVFDLMILTGKDWLSRLRCES